MNVRRALLIVAMLAASVRAGDIRIVERTTEPLLKADRPWEDYCIGYTQVIRDGGAWHMWYASYDHDYRNDADGMLCYASSTDGVKWEKPKLGLVEYGGSRANNILVRRGVHGHCVFIDDAAKPAERFKMVFSDLIGSEWLVFGATSPDGLRWTRGEKPLLAKNSDTQNVCFRDGDVYRLYVRMWTAANFSGKRVVGYSESRTFGDFPDPKVMLAPDERDPPDMHFYNPAIAKLREGLYAMFPSGFHTTTTPSGRTLRQAAMDSTLSALGETSLCQWAGALTASRFTSAPAPFPRRNQTSSGFITSAQTSAMTRARKTRRNMPAVSGGFGSRWASDNARRGQTACAWPFVPPMCWLMRDSSSPKSNDAFTQ